jgi:organic hydroperoxide reductase OsmC/OhrA
MSTHEAHVSWSRTSPDFLYDTYPRAHTVRWGSGGSQPASSAPEYLGDPDRLNPEEAFVGALSSCHMLTFLAICARKRLTVDHYEDQAVGFLEKNAAGRLAITRVELRPVVRFAPGVEVDADALARLHDTAHRNCFIAQSVQSEVRVIG